MTATLSPDELDHTHATANLYFKGLAIMHFDHQTTTWEVNFLRNPRHKLMLTIEGNGRSGDPLMIDFNNPHQIEIIVENGIAPDWEQFPNGYWFSNDDFNRREDRGHPEDFRWVSDLANRSEFLLHALVSRRGGTLGPSLTSVSKVTVKDVIFYTKEKTNEVLTQTLLNVPSPIPYGRTNTWVGADVFCAGTGAVVIKIDGVEHDRLPHVPNSPYKIKIKNSEVRTQNRVISDSVLGDFLLGDFDLFYDFLDFTGIKYNMACRLLSPLRFSDDCNCDGTFVSRFD